jgi:hypothetical protein
MPMAEARENASLAEARLEPFQADIDDGAEGIPPEAFMDHHPRFRVTAFERLPRGGMRRIGVEDLTVPALKALRSRLREREWLKGRTLSLEEIIRTLSPAARKAACSHRLVLPDLGKRFASFSEEVAAFGGADAALGYILRLELSRRAVEEAESLLRDVSHAAVGDPLAHPFCVEPLTGEIILPSERGTIHWERILAPLLDTDPTFGQLVERYSDLVREWTIDPKPPFMFGTKLERWAGINPGRFASYVLWSWADVEVELNRFIARQPVRFVEGGPRETWRLHEAVADLLERRPTPENLREFQKCVTQWNAIQTAQVARVDRGTIVITDGNATRADVADWCFRHLGSTISLHLAVAEGPIREPTLNNPLGTSA